MKKFLIALFFVLCIANSGFAFEDIQVIEDTQVDISSQVINKVEPKVEFKWFDISVDDRQKDADNYKNIVFGEGSKIYLTKDEFKKQFSKYKKDANFKHHYMLTNNGVTDDEDAKYNPFYYRKGTLVIYAIQYKNDIHNSLYYTPYGKLYYVDITSDNYPNYPYYSMQYDRKGNLKSAIYFVSHDIQYMYDSKKEFVGVWNKDKLFNLEGKQTSSRKGW